MSLNPSKGNMYEFVTHTWNAIKGGCPHGCTYCYMTRWGKQKAVRIDQKELKTDLGNGNFIFVGSSCDIFAVGVPREWLVAVIDHCRKFDNRYLFQTKNPYEFGYRALPPKSVLCTTIETNRWYSEVMGTTPSPDSRAAAMSAFVDHERFVTIEPIMDFDVGPMVDLIKECGPVQVNIGADSGNNNLPEPSAVKVLKLIEALSRFTKVVQKPNLGRLLK